MPSLSSVRTLSMCSLLVSGFLTEIAQHIHSLRARGVRSSHAASASASEARVSRKSSGNSWTTPPEISFLVIIISLYSHQITLSCKARRAAYNCPGKVVGQTVWLCLPRIYSGRLPPNNPARKSLASFSPINSCLTVYWFDL